MIEKYLLLKILHEIYTTDRGSELGYELRNAAYNALIRLVREIG